MGISIWQLLIVLLIVILLFGTRRLKTLGADLGAAIKSFRTAVKEGEEQTADNERVLEGEAKRDKERERT